MTSRLVPDDVSSPVKAKGKDWKSHTTRFYGVRFLRGKLTEDEMVKFKGCCSSSESSQKDTYGVSVCILLALSIFAIVLGIAFIAAGYLSPRKNMADLADGKNITNVQKTQKIKELLDYNHMLLTVTISGMVFLAIGGAVFSVIIVAPTCSTSYETSHRDHGQYTLAPTTDTEDSPMKIVAKSTHINKEKPLIDMDNIRNKEKRHVPGYSLHRQQPTAYHIKSTYNETNYLN